jgi:hypothetical protein
MIASFSAMGPRLLASIGSASMVRGWRPHVDSFTIGSYPLLIVSHFRTQAINRRVGLLLGVALAWVLLGASCEDRVLSVAIDQPENRVMMAGESLLLTANVTASGRASRDVTWWSRDDGVASVTPGGMVQAIGAGVTDIVATSTWDPAMAAEIQLTVSSPALTLSLSRSGSGSGSVASAPPGIDCGSTCSADFDEGTSVTLTATPTAGNAFAGWSGACSGTGTCTVSMTQARGVDASFALAPAIEVTPATRDVGAVIIGDTATTTFTVRNAGGGTLAGSASVASPFAITAGGSYELAAGQSATVTVRFGPATVGSVSRDVTFSGGGGASRSVRGEGVPATFGLSLAVYGPGTGTVISDPPGIDCGATCAADFPTGSTVTLTATAGPDSVQTQWSGCQSTSGTTCTVEMTEARSLSVSFERLHVIWVNRIYANQSVPSQDSGMSPSERIPLVANRAGLLRVFVAADRPGVEDAEARLHYRHAVGGPETVVVLDGPTWLPLGPWEGDFRDSFATRLAPDVVRAGLQAYVSVTGSSYGESVSARYPESGFWDLHVVSVPTLDLRLVPVTYRSTTPALGDGRAYLDTTQRMFPFPDDGIQITIGAPYAFDGDLSTPQGWSDLLEDLWWQRFWDPSRPHTYGVVDAGADRVYNGVGYLGHPVGVGYSTLPGAADTAAHELGHNWNRLHAPCGGPPNVDPDFPYPDGRIGVWGYDLVDRRLKSPTEFADLMSYCRPRWVSDYTYRGVMDFRTYVTASALADGLGDTAGTSAPAAAEPLLVLTGRRDADGWHLEAPFFLDAAPEPIPEGPYRLHAWDAGGATIVDVTFGTVPLGVDEGTEAILLTVPLGRADAPRLAGLRIEERGRVLFERTAALRALAVRPTRATRLPDGSVRVTWDAQAYAAALVLDGVGGPLLARDRSGEAVVTASAAQLEVLLSDGLNTVVEVLVP